MAAEIHGNIAKQLQQTGVDYKIHRHEDCDRPIGSPQDFAACLGYEINRITKTLFLTDSLGGSHAMIVCSSPAKVDFEQAARALNVKRLELGSRASLEKEVGYPPTGVSPLGVNGVLPILMDHKLQIFPTILVGGGAVGVEIEISPTDLAAITSAMLGRFSK